MRATPEGHYWKRILEMKIKTCRNCTPEQYTTVGRLVRLDSRERRERHGRGLEFARTRARAALAPFGRRSRGLMRLHSRASGACAASTDLMVAHRPPYRPSASADRGCPQDPRLEFPTRTADLVDIIVYDMHYACTTRICHVRPIVRLFSIKSRRSINSEHCGGHSAPLIFSYPFQHQGPRFLR